MAARWPQVSLETVSWAIFEPEGGYLRRGSRAKGARWLPRRRRRVSEVATLPGLTASGTGLSLSDGSKLEADQYVFACGPWLGILFPEAVGNQIRPTKQDVFFFGTPAGDNRFTETSCRSGPITATNLLWNPRQSGRGFKVAGDNRGAEFDPTSGERPVSPEGLKVSAPTLPCRFPCNEGCSAAGDSRLPVRKQPGQ